MAATVLIDIDCGSDFSYNFELARLAPTANVSGVANAVVTMTPEYGSNVRVTFGNSLSGSNLAITLAANSSANLAIEQDATWLYDARLNYANGATIRVVEGRVHLHPEVS